MMIAMVMVTITMMTTVIWIITAGTDVIPEIRSIVIIIIRISFNRPIGVKTKVCNNKPLF